MPGETAQGSESLVGGAVKHYKRRRPKEEWSTPRGKPETTKLSNRQVAAAQPANGADASVLRTSAPLIGALGVTKKNAGPTAASTVKPYAKLTRADLEQSPIWEWLPEDDTAEPSDGIDESHVGPTDLMEIPTGSFGQFIVAAFIELKTVTQLNVITPIPEFGFKSSEERAIRKAVLA